jgi:hypothetical protein
MDPVCRNGGRAKLDPETHASFPLSYLSDIDRSTWTLLESLGQGRERNCYAKNASFSNTHTSRFGVTCVHGARLKISWILLATRFSSAYNASSSSFHQFQFLLYARHLSLSCVFRRLTGAQYSDVEF